MLHLRMKYSQVVSCEVLVISSFVLDMGSRLSDGQCSEGPRLDNRHLASDLG